VTDHLFAAIGGQVISGDPRSRSRAVEALAPAVAAIVDPVVRSHYIQRLARLGGIDERLALQFITRAGGGTGPTAPRPVASRADLRRARVEKAVAPGGEIQILQLLVQRVECREIGRTLDADLFEDPINRAIFEDWKLEREIEATDDLDEPLAERLELLREAKLAEFEARHVEGMVVDIATKLRLRRSSVRVQAAAVEQAEAVRATRNGRASQAATPAPDPRDPVDAVDVVDPDEDEVESTFLETVSRQRELRRQYRESTDRSRPKQGPVETPS